MAVFKASAATDTRRWTSRLDGAFIFAALFLLAVGFMSLYSVGAARGTDYFKRQVINGVVGVIPFGIFFAVHPKTWFRASRFLYGANLALLTMVLIMGSSRKGAQRWIDLGPLEFQPSEMAKLLVVLTLASFYVTRADKIGDFSTFALGLGHVIVPALLIFKQPHLGATMVVMVTWIAISVVAGVNARYLATTVAVVLLAGVAVFKVPAISERVLQGYQDNRIKAMNTRDLRGGDWQTWRAEIAFGVGGVTGSGYLRGEQKAGGYIPEQQNDFVFTIIGEEGGLIGTSLVLLAFGLFFYRIFLAMVYASDPFYRMVAAGIFGLLAFHTVVNLFMVVQLVPVVGLWLPFLSYGGTALWLCVACVGLILNIRCQEKPLLF